MYLWGGLALIVVGGCSQILGIESLSPSDSVDGGGAADARASADGMTGGLADAAPPDARSVDTSCVDDPVSGPTGTTPVDTDLADDAITNSCGGAGSPEQVFLWTPPTTDYYVIDTFGSGFDTVLAVYDECGGAELACNNNVDELAQSELVTKLAGGQPTVLVVDGVAGDRGAGELHVERVTCPDIDLEGQSVPIEQSTVGFGDDHSVQCGGVGAEDRAYHWVAPADGLYYFRAEAGSFRPLVGLLEGARCSDRELGCNIAASGELGAEVVRYLRAGEVVAVLVDGVQAGGAFQLDIGLSDAPACPAEELPNSGLTVSGFGPYVMAPSCSFARAVDGVGAPFDAGSLTYRFELPGVGDTGSGYCDVIATSQQQLAISALERDDCGGAELGCVLSEPNGTQQRASLRLTLQPESVARTVVLSDRVSFDAGAIDITIECAAIAVR
ncbi:MAG: hypothetical protein Tsb0020_15680 [Haliangiales bacterium]